MNAKVTTYWKFGNRIEEEMPEPQVAAYLDRCRRVGTLKGYVVDAARMDDIQPRAPIDADAVTTIFPVDLAGKIHAAFVLDYRTDKWSTQCGRAIRDAAAVEHRVTVVECGACIRNLTRH